MIDYACCGRCGFSLEENLAQLHKLRTDLASALARAEAAERENAVWRELYWHSYSSGSPLDCCNTSEQHSISVTSNVERETWTGLGTTPTEAAIDLATKLGLLKPAEPLDKAEG